MHGNLKADLVGRWDGSAGSAALYRPAPRVLHIVMQGHVDGANGAAMACALARELASSEGVQTFWDLGDLQRYDTEVRKACTEALMAHRETINTIHAFVSSTLVRMGVSVANVALDGRIRLAESREALQARMDAAIAGRD